MSSESRLPETAVQHTKVTYIDGRPSSITLRRIQLVVMNSKGEPTQHVFDKDTVTIGAVEDNDLVLEDDTVSRNHCRIWLEGDHYMITDLQSTNGTFVNRVRIREAFLKPDVTVTLGKTDIQFAPVDERVNIMPSDKQRFGEIIGRNAALREIYTILEKISPTDATVIIDGETGTGKEVVARTVHQQSRRREGPFVVFDCGAVPENLIESELFGHEKGAFTGALATRQGIFEMANGGTVFLDELGELALDLQPRLLRVLEQREVKRVGGSKSTKVDVRVIAATNRDLQKEVKAGRFREDLFYRLNIVRVSLPPLRERKEDIPLLIKHFLKNGNFNRTREGERKVSQISREALDKIIAYEWPGNVRELHNVVERAVSFADTDTLEVRDLPEHVAHQRAAAPPIAPRMPEGQVGRASAASDANLVAPSGVAPNDATFKDAKEKWVASFERDYIAQLLKKNNQNISHAAREADIDRKYFRKLMKKYGLHDPIAADPDDDAGDDE
ncbi:MAG: sigma 54-interacting transcriptional regulator [Sandaracinaceae bacterium]|nr:sigma 54-interacting transcriptional regulator [Sandaracinaceae bacterium]